MQDGGQMSTGCNFVYIIKKINKILGKAIMKNLRLQFCF